MNDKEFLNCKKVDTAISRAKKMLVEQAKKNGICESFGQEEVRLIRDKFVDATDYTFHMNNIRSKIDAFDNWCMSYCG